MNLSAAKLDIIQRICEIEDNDIITFPDASKSDWWSHITQDEKDSIHRGLNDLQQGNVVPHSQIRKKYDPWIGNQVD